MADEWLSTGDLPLDTAQTLVELVEQMNRLYTRAGEPSLRGLEQENASGAAQPSKISRILDGLENPGLADLVAFLAVCQVAMEDQARWLAAWRRVSGQPPTTIDVELRTWELRQQAEELRERTAAELLQTRQRCAERLRSLRAELAEFRLPPPVGTPAGARTERVLEIAIQLQETIDDAHRDVLAISVLAVETEPSAVPPNGPAEDAVSPNVSLVSTVLQHVPPAIAARLLLAMDITTINAIATKSPEVMGNLVSTLSPADAGRWLPSWHADAVLAVLSTMESAIVARCLEQMDGAPALTILAGMGHDVATEVLVALPRETASRRLSEMDRMTAARLLQLFDPEDAAGHLLQIEDLRRARPREFLPHMTRDFARKCLRLMDQRRSERKQAADLLRQVEKNRQDEGLTAFGVDASCPHGAP